MWAKIKLDNEAYYSYGRLHTDFRKSDWIFSYYFKHRMKLFSFWNLKIRYAHPNNKNPHPDPIAKGCCSKFQLQFFAQRTENETDAHTCRVGRERCTPVGINMKIKEEKAQATKADLIN